LEALIGVLVSSISLQRGQMNTCRIAFSAATRADLDQAISTLQESQIGRVDSKMFRWQGHSNPETFSMSDGRHY
jgi:hypothetical protein